MFNFNQQFCGCAKKKTGNSNFKKKSKTIENENFFHSIKN